MDWLFEQSSVLLYVASAVLVFWSALFLFIYYLDNRENPALPLWAAAFAAYALEPICSFPVFYHSPVSPWLFLLSEAAGSGLLVAGMLVNKTMRRLLVHALTRWGVISAGLALFLIFIPVSGDQINFWTIALFLGEGAVIFSITLIKVKLDKAAINLPVYVAMFFLVALCVYFSIVLALFGSIAYYAELETLKVLLLSNTLTSLLLGRAARKLMKAKARLEMLVDNTSHGMAFIANSGKLVQINSRMLEILGVDACILSKGVPTLASSGLERLPVSCMQAYERTEQTIQFDELQKAGYMVTRAGVAWLDVSVRKVWGKGETASGWFVQIEDITESLNTEHELQAKRSQIDMLFQAVGACEYVRKGLVITSDQLFSVLGYPVYSMSLLEVFELVHPEDRHKYHWQAITEHPDAKAQPFIQEIRFRNAAGEYVWYHVFSHSMTIEDSYVVVGMALNIDARKRMESFAMQSDRLAAVGQLASGIAHDMNNHLMTMQTSLGLLTKVANEALRSKYYNYIQEAINNSTNMLKQLVNFSKGDSGEYKPMDIVEMLRHSVELMRHSVGYRSLVSLEESVDSFPVNGNYYELQNVILNIGFNARDALPPTDGTIAIRSWFSEQNSLKEGATGWFNISIKDNGCGMSNEVQSKIFHPFFSTKSNGKGSGLGLFISYGTVQRHGGTISVESVENVGTLFVLSFPAAIECVKSQKIAQLM